MTGALPPSAHRGSATGCFFASRTSFWNSSLLPVNLLKYEIQIKKSSWALIEEVVLCGGSSLKVVRKALQELVLGGDVVHVEGRRLVQRALQRLRKVQEVDGLHVQIAARAVTDGDARFRHLHSKLKVVQILQDVGEASQVQRGQVALVNDGKQGRKYAEHGQQRKVRGHRAHREPIQN